MFYSTELLLALLVLGLTGCALNPEQNAINNYPSAALVEQGKVIEQQHDYAQLAARLSQPINSALLRLFVDPTQHCDWHLSKWNKTTGRLGFLLDCDNGLNEIIFKGQMTGQNYQITDIYHHNMGLWLSELNQTMRQYAEDLPAWALVINAIESNNAAQVLTGLSQLKHRNFISQILSIEYTQPFNEIIANKIMTYTLNTYAEQVQAGMLTLHAAIKQQDWPLALLQIAAIENKVGLSEMTQLAKSKVYWLSGDPQQAYYYAIHTYKTGIRTLWPINALIAYSIESGDFPTAIELLSLTYSEVENWNSEWLTEFINGDLFIRQAAYIQWRQSVIQ